MVRDSLRLALFGSVWLRLAPFGSVVVSIFRIYTGGFIRHFLVHTQSSGARGRGE